MINTQSFGLLLRERRKVLRLTQAQLAERAGLSASAVEKLEGGQRHPSQQVAVATLCARLNGLPLAIELVAARIKMLPPAALAQRFGASEGQVGLHLLSLGARDLPQRHRTLRAAIGWSYDLLNEDERILFSRLGVFAGGYTLTSVDAICNAKGDLVVPSLDSLQSLFDKSLLKREASPGGEEEPRYTMLEMVREYAAQRLAEGGEDEKVRGWFLDYYLALTVAARPHLVSAEQNVWVSKLDVEESNILSALRWATDSGRIEIAATMAVALFNYWYNLGKITEGRGWLEDLAARADQLGLQEGLQIELHNCAGFLAVEQYDFDRAGRLLSRSLTLSRQTADKSKIAITLANLSGMEMYRGNWERAASLLREAIDLHRELGDSRRIGLGTGSLAEIAFNVGNFEEAISLDREAISLIQAAGDNRHTSLAFTTLSLALCRSGRLDEAESAAREALAILEGLDGHVSLLSGAINCLAEIARSRGDLSLARELYCQAMGEVRELGISAADKVIVNLHGLGLLAISGGEGRRAAILFSAEARLIERTRMGRAPWAKVECDEGLAAARASLGETEWAGAWSRGQAMSLDEIMSFALEEADPI